MNINRTSRTLDLSLGDTKVKLFSDTFPESSIPIYSPSLFTIGEYLHQQDRTIYQVGAHFNLQCLYGLRIFLDSVYTWNNRIITEDFYKRREPYELQLNDLSATSKSSKKKTRKKKKRRMRGGRGRGRSSETKVGVHTSKPKTTQAKEGIPWL